MAKLLKNNINRAKRRGQRGATAVEFAFVATPFLLMFFSLIELMMIFFAQTALESAVANQARLIRTGQAQSAGAPISKTQFKSLVCAQMYGMADCANRLFVMVEAFSTAPTAAQVTPWADGTLVPGSAADEPYQSSVAGQMVIVRAYYVWPLMTPGMAQMLNDYNSATLGTANRMLVATAAFKNEPF